MKKEQFIEWCYPWAKAASERFKLNPVVILAQAALESGWGTSTLSVTYHNYFGFTGYGKNSDWWSGERVTIGNNPLFFRVYSSPRDSFMDHSRLITTSYKAVAEMSYHIEAYAHEMAYSPYISDSDNRESYRKALISIAKDLEGRLPEVEISSKS